MRLSRTVVAVSGVAMLGLAAMPAQAAHEGNNRAELSGSAAGTALVNYAKGNGSWTAGARVAGLAPGTYTFTVTSPNGMTVMPVCTFEADGRGTDGCSARLEVLGGFATAEIRDAGGTVVSSGRFDRRGNCREADQAGSQCEAPGRQG
jgi:hypothetical protein